MLLGKGVLKTCSKFTGEHQCRSAISIKLQSNFVESILQYGCSPVNLLLIFRTPFPKNTPGGLLPKICFHERRTLFNLFQVNVLFLRPMKTSENKGSLISLGDIEKKTLACNCFIIRDSGIRLAKQNLRFAFNFEYAFTSQCQI